MIVAVSHAVAQLVWPEAGDVDAADVGSTRVNENSTASAHKNQPISRRSRHDE
jgi:hypothetical protein